MYKYSRNYENLNKCIFQGIGDYDIPMIQPTQYDSCEFIGFNYAKSSRFRNEKGIHFFLDDYQFCRVWTQINNYLDLFIQFKYVMSPDFSMYQNYPKAMQIYNHYRKHWIGAYLQRHGINVIPTVSWAARDSYSWCFDGEPKYSVVAVSSVGTQQDKESKRLFLEGYQEMMDRLQPEQVIFYGRVPEECKGNIILIKAFYEKFNKSKGDGNEV